MFNAAVGLIVDVVLAIPDFIEGYRNADEYMGLTDKYFDKYMNSTVFAVFILSFLIGVIIRLMFLKWKRGYILSGVFALISVIVWLWTKHLANHGVDGTVMLWGLMATELAIGSLIVGGLSLLIKKMKHQKANNLP